MTEHLAYIIADTETEAQTTFRHWLHAGPEERRILETWQVVFKGGEADARYRLARYHREGNSHCNAKIWKLALDATKLDVALSETGIPPYAEGDVITVYDRPYGLKYRAEVTEVLLAGAKRPWLVSFESLKPIEPTDSRHYVGSLEAHDNGTSPHIVKETP